jgi:hypothetical protein
VQLIATFLIVNGAADDIKKMKLLGTEAKGRGTANFLKKERGEHRCRFQESSTGGLAAGGKPKPHGLAPVLELLMI